MDRDWKELLRKYIQHVVDMESVDYLSDTYVDESSYGDDPLPFTQEELAELRKLARRR